ncbi:MAG: DUF2835 domain-containing protein [bacterium]
MANSTFILTLKIGAEEYQKLYAGQVRDVVARANNGQTVRFPASVLRPFVSHQGVYGTFELEVDGNLKLAGIRRRGG